MNIDIMNCKTNFKTYFILNGLYKDVFTKNFKRCNMKSKSKQPPNKYVEAFKPYLLTLLFWQYLLLYI